MAFKSGDKHPNWKGGRIITSKGYILVNCPNHICADRDGYVSEHRLMMENHIGKILTKDEHVHHKNENRSDNRIENLELLSKGKHRSKHAYINGFNKVNLGRKQNDLWKKKISLALIGRKKYVTSQTKIKNLFENGVNINRISKQLGISYGTVKRYVYETRY